MGRTYIYECSNCDYNVKVAGGFSEGRDFAVQTILCDECGDLQDAVTRARLPTGTDAASAAQTPAPSFIEIVNKLPSMGLTWAEYEPACLRFPSHQIREWKEPDRCPRCSAFMEPSSLPFRQWD